MGAERYRHIRTRMKDRRSTDFSYVSGSDTSTRPAKKALFLIVANAIQLDSEWKRLYDRLVPKKCSYDERTREYKGKKKVIGHIAGQMISLIYGLLKRDQEVLRSTLPGQTPPEPELYDAAKHKAQR